MWWRRVLLGSIRARLLLILCGGLGLVMIAMFVLLDRGIDSQIYGRLDKALLSRAHGIMVLLESHPAAEALAEVQAMSPEYGGGGHTDFLQLWGSGGRTLLASDSNAAANLQPPQGVPANAPYFYDLTLPDGHRGRAVALRVALQGQAGEAVLAVAEEREQVDTLERQVHIALVTGVMLSSLIAALLAVLAVRSGLRPLFAFGAAVSAGAESARLASDEVPRELRPFATALNDALGRLRAALERERRFARDVAHELRTPLAEVRTAVELARRDPSASSSLDGAIASADRMGRSINALLAVSRYESGQEQAHIEPLDVAQLVRSSQALADGPAARRRLRVELDIPAECWVHADPALLERIVDNLLLNAVEYAPEDSQVQVRLRCEGDVASLCIGNEAPELSSDDTERMGERFWRKSPAREATRHGGLGLALARTLAEVLDLKLAFRLEGSVLWAELRGLRRLHAEN